jgi:hypothetical protein
MRAVTAPVTPTAEQLAEIAAAELVAGRTAILTPQSGQDWAISANGRWDYEQMSPRRWLIWNRKANTSGGIARTLDAARRDTFEADHPLHDHPRPEPRPVRYEVV